MKKCPNCGKEYPDEVERCLIDNELLLSGQPQTEVLSTTEPVPVSTARSAESIDWRRSIFEILLVCGVAFGVGLMGSVYSLIFPINGSATSGDTGGDISYAPAQIYKWLVSCFRELMALVLLGYVLRRRGWSFRDLGLTWAWRDLGWGIVLVMVTNWSCIAFYDFLYVTGFTTASHKVATLHAGQILFGGGVTITTLLFQIINPFFEELIVRAYLITEIMRLSGSAAKAVAVSVILQTSYHLYQGIPSALSLGVIFLISSIYYVRTKRIMPVIIAHLFMDVGATLWFMAHR